MTREELVGAGQKIELLFYVRQIADPYLCESIYRTENRELLVDALEFLYEDVSLGDISPERAEFIGLGEAETIALTQFASVFDVIAQSTGFSSDNTLYLDHKDWPDVIEKAQAALRISLQPR